MKSNNNFLIGIALILTLTGLTILVTVDHPVPENTVRNNAPALSVWSKIGLDALFVAGSFALTAARLLSFGRNSLT